MRTFGSLHEVHLQNSWVTVGSFDGVHTGHQALIAELVKAAHGAGDPAVVVTFYPHPAVVLRDIRSPYYLSSPEERNNLLADLGVDGVVTLKFDRKMSQESAENFVIELKRFLGMKQLWVGQGFTLGKNKEGDAAILGKLGRKHHFTFMQIGEVGLEGTPVSSSRIRALLADGEMELVTELLGRPYRLTGKVVHGNDRGRKLGTPTANLDVQEEQLLPRLGIYATWLWWQRKRYPAVTNVGFRPTFGSDPSHPLVEPHILGFDQDLYGQMLTLEFLKYLRPERKFKDPERLKKQIQKDIKEAQEVFANAPKTPGLPARSKTA